MTADPDQLSHVLEAKLRKVSDAIINKPPLCSGTWETPSESFQLCFRTGGDSARWIDLLNATESQLESLANACAPATFGLDDKNILDLSYRKAGKMDVTDFMSRFDADDLGLSEFVRGQLLEGDQDLKALRTELYKLNVYGKDSFFKPHKDTPRGVDMIGSLVVIFPTPHQGGTLILRHDRQEYTFDPSLKFSQVEKPSVGYVAFYSDVEHEVIPVKSGYRVSLTYNLYVCDATQQQGIRSALPESVMHNELKLKQALLELLDEKTFLPEGGTIGFGLLHKYPVSKTKGSLESVLSCLKGSDAGIRRVCTSLGVNLTPKVLYKEKCGSLMTLVNDFVELEYVEEAVEDVLCADGFGFIVKSRGLKENGGGEFNPEHLQEGYYEVEQDQYQDIWWLTKRTELTRETTEFVAPYGNEPALCHTYGDVVLIATLGEPGNRQIEASDRTHKRRRVSDSDSD